MNDVSTGAESKEWGGRGHESTLLLTEKNGPNKFECPEHVPATNTIPARLFFKTPSSHLAELAELDPTVRTITIFVCFLSFRCSLEVA